MLAFLSHSFLWQIGIAEFCALSFLIIMSFTSTYYAKKYLKHKFVYGIFYGSSMFFSGIIGFSVLYLLLLISNTLDEIPTTAVPLINPMGNLLFLFSLIFDHSNLNTNNWFWINLVYLFLIHLLAIVFSCLFWSFLRRKLKLSNDFKHVDILRKKEFLVGLFLIFIFTLATYIINRFVSASGLWLTGLARISLNGVATISLLLSARYLFKEFNFPTNIYVSLASFIMSLVHKKTRFIENLVFMLHTVLAFVSSSFFVSLLTFI
ncbi:hypothetical protein [Mycoplasma buteonis]|uniref:hypothetical protein n=1 Tax=Mycoplasma buteonis TaxID=171280 RepID=UPI000565CB57|nr:hypothetical protein [Mycoplasma buteonis]